MFKLASRKVGSYAGQHCFVQTSENIVHYADISQLIPALADTVEELLNAYKGLLCYQKIINTDTENLKSEKYFAIKM